MAEFKPKVWMHCPLCNKPSPMPDPDVREWVGLTEGERNDLEDYCEMIIGKVAFDAIEARLKERNT